MPPTAWRGWRPSARDGPRAERSARPHLHCVGGCVGPFWPDRARRPRYVRRWVKSGAAAQPFFQAFGVGGMAPAQPCRRFRTKGRAGARPRPVCSTSCRASSVESAASAIRKNIHGAAGIGRFDAGQAAQRVGQQRAGSRQLRAQRRHRGLAVLQGRRRRPLHGIEAQELLYSISLARSSVSDAGTTIQPTRHPVMDQALEKLLTEMTRSSGAQCLRKDGADASAGS